MYAPAFPPHLSVTCLWLLTGHLPLDLYHDRFTQDLLIRHGALSLGRSHRNKYQDKGITRSIPQRSMYVKYAPSNPCPHFKGACPWLLIGHILMDLYHAKFSQDLHMGHVLPPVSSRYMETVLLQLQFPGC